MKHMYESGKRFLTLEDYSSSDNYLEIDNTYTDDSGGRILPLTNRKNSRLFDEPLRARCLLDADTG